LGAIRREPTPAGPITELFDRLDDLHAQAGRPSMRVIAVRAGRGNVSSSTVHNIFRSARVPRWELLEHVVLALDGAGVRGEFLALWRAAENASDAISEHLADGSSAPGRHPPGLTSRGTQATAPGSVRDWMHPAPMRILSNEIPSRNQYFTGRAAELEVMRANLSDPAGPHVQVIVGMGGVGKTEFATEYVHQNIGAYEIIWWIRAEHHDRVREALVKLAQRLGLRQGMVDGDRDKTIKAVLDWLQSEAQPSWLLVYDNAADPSELQRYLPAGRPGGHVVITSRLLNWPSYVTAAESVEISPFTENEAVEFLRRRVPGLGTHMRGLKLADDENARRVSDAMRLAAELGHLPLAVDHAAAYLCETKLTVDEYLTQYTMNAHLLLSAEDGDLPAPVSGTWATSTALLDADAEHLFNLCAFFSPEPIPAELFLPGNAGVDDPSSVLEFLASPLRFRAAASKLHRLSLVRFDGARDHIQMHRVVQAVTRDRIRQDRRDMYYAYRAAVDTLLAGSNPGNPDYSSNDAVYDLSLQHLESPDHRFLNTDNAALRRLIIDQVRRLRLRGAVVEALRFGQDALRVWRERLGEDHLDVLTMSVEVANAMHFGGYAANAHELIMQIRPRLRHYADGDGFKVLLYCESFYGGDLRARSQFHEALDLDLEILPKFEAAFGTNHERTLNVRNNVATDYRQLGRFQDALQVDRRTYEDRRRILGPNDLWTLYSASSLARDLRGLGQYQESLDIARKVSNSFAAINARESTNLLYAREGFAIALRKSGHHWDALQESEEVLQRYRDYLGSDHISTLRSAADVINAMRAVGELAGAEELALITREACLRSGHPDDLLSAVLVSLASVLRAGGRPAEALAADEQARRMLLRLYGDRHPSTLAASINYASDLAACGRLGEAIQFGYELLDRCRAILGDDHPDSLMAAANLAIDEAAAGNQAAADQRRDDVLRRYAETLTLEHPEARAAAQGIRLTAEIEALVD
jgi:tetratricopeptide (TPR) repeat protein